MINNNEKKYDLKEIYSDETPFKRYMRLTIGEGATLRDLFLTETLLGTCSGLPGIIGLGMRNKLYPFLFRHVSRDAVIGKHVTLRCPKQIELESHVVIDDFVQLIATSNNEKAISIGEGSFVRSFAMINSGPPEGYVSIGKNSSIGQGVLLYGNGGLTIGDHVMIAGQTAIIASSHIFANKEIPMIAQGYSAKGITIGDNVWVGAGVKILDGVSIGSGAIIGANAVVNRSVTAGQHVGGIPAIPLNTRY